MIARSEVLCLVLLLGGRRWHFESVRLCKASAWCITAYHSMINMNTYVKLFYMAPAARQVGSNSACITKLGYGAHSCMFLCRKSCTAQADRTRKIEGISFPRYKPRT